MKMIEPLNSPLITHMTQTKKYLTPPPPIKNPGYATGPKYWLGKTFERCRCLDRLRASTIIRQTSIYYLTRFMHLYIVPL